MLPVSYLQKIKIGANRPSDFASVGCLHPQKIWITDTETGQNRQIYVSCGKCLNCRNTRRNEWVSRMVLHSFSYKHCYFVTLTYGSYDLNNFIKHPFQNDWLSTYPVCDTHNSLGTLAWTPSILRHEHLTKFLKRLRKNHDSLISYVACGEYGEKFGRPHFHLLLWTNSVLTPYAIREAWGYNVVQLSDNIVVQDNGKYDNSLPHLFFEIGHVDLVDLVVNGSLDPHKSLEDCQGDKHARHIFSYVAKYIGKQDALTLWDASSYKYAYNRVKAVFNSLPMSDRCEVHAPHDSNIVFEQDGETKYISTHKSTKEVEEYVREGISIVPLDCEKTINFTYNNIYYENIDFFKFANICGPFFVSSRTYAIGKQYALENLERFKSGNFALPEFQGRSLAFPHYFATMAQNSEYPLRFEKCVLSGKSLTRGSLPYVHGFFETLRENKYIVYTIGHVTEDTCPFCNATRVEKSHTAFRKAHVRNDFGSIDGNILHGSLLDLVLIRDDVGSIHYYYDREYDVFRGFRFDRCKKEYVLYDVFDRIDFCDMVLFYIEKKWSTLADRQRVQGESLELFDLIENDPLTTSVRESYLLERENEQINYKTNHKDFQ